MNMLFVVLRIVLSLAAVRPKYIRSLSRMLSNKFSIKGFINR